ncbi:hypothetical protein L804_02875 [Cryptococcus deuterogattii 2001/935-1]|nr:hypothetical protein L804_02875 [Cryptococcus deuterogattii 2001/935-1]
MPAEPLRIWIVALVAGIYCTGQKTGNRTQYVQVPPSLTRNSSVSSEKENLRMQVPVQPAVVRDTPWHIEALPEQSPTRLKLGEFKAAMYNNIAAPMHKMAEADFKTDLISYFYTKLKEMLGLSSASQCCWTVIGTFPYEIILDLDETFPDQKHVAQMMKYFDDQAMPSRNSIRKLGTRDIDEQLKIPMSPGEVTYYFGPFSWRNNWKEKRDIMIFRHTISSLVLGLHGGFAFGHKRRVGTSREHEAKEFKEALRAYADAWYQLYVYRIEALRPSDPLRQSLGRSKRAPSDKDSQGAIRSSNGPLWIRILYIRMKVKTLVTLQNIKFHVSCPSGYLNLELDISIPEEGIFVFVDTIQCVDLLPEQLLKMEI